MSIYDTDRVKLPQVKIPESLKSKLFHYLEIFGRNYADFIRDICDINIKWHTKDPGLTFHDQVRYSASVLVSRYQRKPVETQLTFFDEPPKDKRLPVAERLALHRYPTKKISRLPHVYVSKWQADNLYGFLNKFARSYADFIRMICENIAIDPIDAQANVPQFAGTNFDIFLKAFDEIIGIEQYKEKRIKREWPVEYWNQRRANHRRNHGETKFMGR